MGSCHHPSVIYNSCSTKDVILVLFVCWVHFICFRNFILHGSTVHVNSVFLTINFCEWFESATVKVIFLVVWIGRASNSLLFLWKINETVNSNKNTMTQWHTYWVCCGQEATYAAALPAGVGHEQPILQTHPVPGPGRTPGVLIKATWELLDFIELMNNWCLPSAHPQAPGQALTINSNISTLMTFPKPMVSMELTLKSLSSSHAPYLLHFLHSGVRSPTFLASPLLSGNLGSCVRLWKKLK